MSAGAEPRRSGGTGRRSRLKICRGLNHVPVRFRPSAPKKYADVVQLARTLPCQGRGCGFETHHPLHMLPSTTEYDSEGTAA